MVTLGPQAKEGENVFGVAHIFASFNDTFVHVTDLSGRETIVKVTGGMKVKADRDESSPYAAMLAAQDVSERCKQLGINALHVKLRATGRRLNFFSFKFCILRWNENENTWTGCSISSPRFGSFRNENWSNRRCYSNSIGFHSS